MRFFEVLSLLALPHMALGSHSDRCPCIGNHSESAALKLKRSGSCGDQFGIGCNTHDINESCAIDIYESNTAAQLKCGPSYSGESPWCNTTWCYVDPENCTVDFEWGVLGQAYSYATCGNLRQGNAEYFQKSLAAFLQNDSLRVLHPETSLKGGYLGNTGCREYEKYSQNRNCQGRVADFWERSLNELSLSQVKIDHKLIRRVGNGTQNGIDQYFIDSKLKEAFEEYKGRFPDQWLGQPTTNFDLCAFATGMGYVDLCSGAFSLTHRRQAMTFMIELYTAPVFIISKSKCDFFASDSGWDYWAWWISIFSPEAWGFFVGVVFFCIVAMKGLDKWIEYLESEDPKKPQEQQSRMEKFGECFCCLTHGLADVLLGVFEAFVFKSKTSHKRDSNKPSRSRPSHMLRLGLGFFILMSTAVYGAGVTAEMVAAKEVKGEVRNLEEAQRLNIPLCTHAVLEEPLRPYQVDNLTRPYDDWEDVLEGLRSGACSAALLDDEAWNTFRNRGKLCEFHKEPTAVLYVPTGVVVSKRAYRTLETFRFDPNETAFFFDKKRVPLHACSANTADSVCAKIEKEGVPGYTLFSLFVVAAGCGVCSLIGIAHHRFVGQDEENDEEKEKKMKDEQTNMANMAKIETLFDLEFGKMSKVLEEDKARKKNNEAMNMANMAKLESLLGLEFGKLSKALEEDKKKNMKDEEMNMANMAKIESLLDHEFGKISKVLQQSKLRPQAAAGSNAALQDDVGSSGGSTGSPISSHTPPTNPTNICCPW